jgi:hypothetical protein
LARAIVLCPTGNAQVGRRLVAEIIDDIELLSSQQRMGNMVAEFEQDFLPGLIRPNFWDCLSCGQRSSEDCQGLAQ